MLECDAGSVSIGSSLSAAGSATLRMSTAPIDLQGKVVQLSNNIDQGTLKIVQML